MIPPDFSLFDVVLEMRKQRPAAVQTEVSPGSPTLQGQRPTAVIPPLPSLPDGLSSQQEQYRFLYHTVAQMFRSTLQNASPLYQNLKEVQRPLSHSPVHPQHPQRPGPRAGSSTQDSWEAVPDYDIHCAFLRAPLPGCRLLSFLPERCERPGQLPPSCFPPELRPSLRRCPLPPDAPSTSHHTPPTRRGPQVPSSIRAFFPDQFLRLTPSSSLKQQPVPCSLRQVFAGPFFAFSSGNPPQDDSFIPVLPLPLPLRLALPSEVRPFLDPPIKT
ncbi:Tyrosine-protein phosphatase non-receptor type 18 [Plecturocebus cupreus]